MLLPCKLNHQTRESMHTAAAVSSQRRSQPYQQLPTCLVRLVALQGSRLTSLQRAGSSMHTLFHTTNRINCDMCIAIDLTISIFPVVCQTGWASSLLAFFIHLFQKRIYRDKQHRFLMGWISFFLLTNGIKALKKTQSRDTNESLLRFTHHSMFWQKECCSPYAGPSTPVAKFTLIAVFKIANCTRILI